MVFRDRVLETTTTTGTSALTLDGAVAGYQTFAAVLTAGDTCGYAVFAVDASGVPTGEWETGTATWNGSTLARTTVEASSNAGSLVDFAAGTKHVLLGVTAATMASLTARGARYRVPFGFASALNASEVILLHTFPNAVTFPANFSGAVAYVGTPPAASAVLTVGKAGGGAVGTITIATSGGVTFSTTGGASVSFTAGETLTVTAPASADAALTNSAITLVGSET